MKIKISADSTCDLTAEQIAQYNIGITPLYINKGTQSLKDGVEIMPQDIFDYVDSGAGICHTAAVNVADYQEFFSQQLKEYDAVIHINISSGLSACNQDALIAAEDFETVYVVDSRNLSSGTGLLVIEAALMAEKGMAPQEIVDELNALAQRVDASFIINTLKYLHKGGRCSAVAALGANLLKLKPCIEVLDGKMDVGKKYRGNFETVILQYVADRLSVRDDIDPRRVFITYSLGTPEKSIEDVRNALLDTGLFDEVLSSVAGCTVSNHCGPSTLGILFFRNR